MAHQVIVVGGGGGIGSWLTEGLVRLLEYRSPGSVLTIVDGDDYEPKNKERQKFDQLGNKAQIRAAELQEDFFQTLITPLPYWVVEAYEGEPDPEPGGLITVPEILKDAGDGCIIFSTVDNHACRKVIFDAARNVENIDVLTGGNDEGFEGSGYHYMRRNGVDVTDHPANWHQEFVNPPDRNPGDLNCQERAELEGGTQIMATNMSVAAWLLAKAHLLIEGGHEEILSETAEFLFDLRACGARSFKERKADPVPVTVS